MTALPSSLALRTQVRSADREAVRRIVASTGFFSPPEIEIAGEKVMHAKPKNKFVQLSPEETAKFKKKVQPVFDRFVKMLDDSGANGKQILADVETLEAKYSN